MGVALDLPSQPGRLPRGVLNRTLWLDPKRTNHEISFSPAKAGSLLVMILSIQGSSAAPIAPSGWSIAYSNGASSTMYHRVFTKTATQGESQVLYTSSNANFAVFNIYEFPAGSTFVAGANGQTLTGMSGTNVVFRANSGRMVSGITAASFAWSGTPTPIEQVDPLVPSHRAPGRAARV